MECDILDSVAIGYAPAIVSQMNSQDKNFWISNEKM